ncbi:hypothetical protein ACMD2_11509 [Ananas comosus]|uniref:DUF620 domain-containing protein n=1 Tax=Ananas comosus TaxID=4615 RepID=A0A199V1L0_ANACO|nr:hypothetical protein ACMD2_11509 [Ananas comosus]
MRKLCPNFDREDGLDTVLEVPIPDEMFAAAAASGGGGGGSGARSLQNLRAWLKAQAFDRASVADGGCGGGGGGGNGVQISGRTAELQLLLNVVGSPLIPCPVPHDRAFSRSIRDCSIQASTAKYIIQQYIAATGGQAALQAATSMYAVGKVRMCASEFHVGDENSPQQPAAAGKLSGGEIGGYGLDPRSTANLFSDAVCIGERITSGEECFILKLEANPATLKARSAAAFDIIHHTIWGYFSQRTGLLIQLEDSHLLRMKSGHRRRGESIFWETSMESTIQDYRYVGGVNIAHAGRTNITLFRYGEGSVNHKRKMEETWTIEEVDFDVWGLTADYFLPPADLKKEQDGNADDQQ